MGWNLHYLAEKRNWPLAEPQKRDHRIVLVVRERRVVVRISHLVDTELTLHVRVDLPPPGLPAFRITDEGFGSFMAGLVGGQDIQTGVPNFDYAYRVRSPEPEELLRMWTRKWCEYLLTHLSGATARGKHDHLELRLIRAVFPDQAIPELDDDTIVHAITLAVELAHAEVYGAAELRALPEAIYRERRERGPHVELPGPSPITIGPVRTHTGVATRAEIQGVLSDPAPSFQDAALHQDGDRVAVTWPGIERDPARLLAAVELLRGLRSPSSEGAYR